MGLFKQTAPPPVEKTTSNKLYRPLAFTSLKDDELGAIYNVAPVKKLTEGTVIAPLDAHQDWCYVIMSGSVRFAPAADDTSSSLAVLGRGEWFGRIGAPEALPYTPIACEPTTVMQFTAAAMNQLPAKVQTAITAALLNSTLKSLRTVAEGAQQAADKMEVLSQYTNTLVESRVLSTQTFMERYLSELPKLPQHANNLALKLLNERTTPQEVADGVKGDPSLAALVLQTVNSPYYGLRTKILDYYRACLLLGFNNIYRLVLDKSLQEIMPNTEESRGILEHSYLVSLFAHEIAKLSGKVNPPMAVTVGLLHDVGKSVLLLLKQRHPELQSALTTLDSSAVGASVLTSWQLPADIARIVGQQSTFAHTPPERMPQEHRHTIGNLYLAHGCADLVTENVYEPASRIFANDYLSDIGFPNLSLKDFYVQKLHPAIVREQKCLPEPIRKVLAITNTEEPLE